MRGQEAQIARRSSGRMIRATKNGRSRAGIPSRKIRRRESTRASNGTLASCPWPSRAAQVPRQMARGFVSASTYPPVTRHNQEDLATKGLMFAPPKVVSATIRTTRAPRRAEQRRSPLKSRCRCMDWLRMMFQLVMWRLLRLLMTRHWGQKKVALVLLSLITNLTFQRVLIQPVLVNQSLM